MTSSGADPLVLDAKTRLEAVVAAVGVVLILADAGIARELPEGVHAAVVRESVRGAGSIVLCPGGINVLIVAVTSHAAGIHHSCCTGRGRNVHQADVWRQAVDRVVDNVLVPSQVANVLDNPNNRRNHFTLHTEAELGHSGSPIGLGNAVSIAREDQRVRRDRDACIPVRSRVGEIDAGTGRRDA